MRETKLILARKEITAHFGSLAWGAAFCPLSFFFFFAMKDRYTYGERRSQTKKSSDSARGALSTELFSALHFFRR
jgi:hypothetical protein